MNINAFIKMCLVLLSSFSITYKVSSEQSCPASSASLSSVFNSDVLSPRSDDKALYEIKFRQALEAALDTLEQELRIKFPLTYQYQLLYYKSLALQALNRHLGLTQQKNLIIGQNIFFPVLSRHSDIFRRVHTIDKTKEHLLDGFTVEHTQQNGGRGTNLNRARYLKHIVDNQLVPGFRRTQMGCKATDLFLTVDGRLVSYFEFAFNQIVAATLKRTGRPVRFKINEAISDATVASVEEALKFPSSMNPMLSVWEYLRSVGIEVDLSNEPTFPLVNFATGEFHFTDTDASGQLINITAPGSHGLGMFCEILSLMDMHDNNTGEFMSRRQITTFYNGDGPNNTPSNFLMADFVAAGGLICNLVAIATPFDTKGGKVAERRDMISLPDGRSIPINYWTLLERAEALRNKQVELFERQGLTADGTGVDQSKPALFNTNSYYMNVQLLIPILCKIRARMVSEEAVKLKSRPDIDGSELARLAFKMGYERFCIEVLSPDVMMVRDNKRRHLSKLEAPMGSVVFNVVNYLKRLYALGDTMLLAFMDDTGSSPEQFLLFHILGELERSTEFTPQKRTADPYVTLFHYNPNNQTWVLEDENAGHTVTLDIETDEFGEYKYYADLMDFHDLFGSRVQISNCDLLALYGQKVCFIDPDPKKDEGGVIRRHKGLNIVLEGRVGVYNRTLRKDIINLRKHPALADLWDARKNTLLLSDVIIIIDESKEHIEGYGLTVIRGNLDKGKMSVDKLIQLLKNDSECQKYWVSENRFVLPDDRKIVFEPMEDSPGSYIVKVIRDPVFRDENGHYKTPDPSEPEVQVAA